MISHSSVSSHLESLSFLQNLCKSPSLNISASSASTHTSDFSGVTSEVLMAGLKRQMNVKVGQTISFDIAKVVEKLVALDRKGQTYDAMQDFYDKVCKKILPISDIKIICTNGSMRALRSYINRIIPLAIAKLYIAKHTDSDVSVAKKIRMIRKIPMLEINKYQDAKPYIQDVFRTLGDPGKVLAKIIDLLDIKYALYFISNNEFFTNTINRYVKGMPVVQEDSVENLLQNYIEIINLAKLLTLVDVEDSPVFHKRGSKFKSLLGQLRNKALKIAEKVIDLLSKSLDDSEYGFLPNITSLKRLKQISELIKNSKDHPIFTLQSDASTNFFNPERVTSSRNNLTSILAKLPNNVSLLDKVCTTIQLASREIERTGGSLCPLLRAKMFLKRGAAFMYLESFESAREDFTDAIAIANSKIAVIDDVQLQKEYAEIISNAYNFLNSIFASYHADDQCNLISDSAQHNSPVFSHTSPWCRRAQVQEALLNTNSPGNTFRC